jgi:hypothetical protein
MTEKPKIIYAVTEGDYSDYRVQALFTTKALANEHAKSLTKDYSTADVEEFLLFDRPVGKKTVYSINARIWPDGTVTSEHRDRGDPKMDRSVQLEYGDYTGIPKPIMEARLLQAPYSGKDWLVRVSGTDKARVMKSFQDRVAQGRARTLGIEA